jgi:hypothetical protein
MTPDDAIAEYRQVIAEYDALHRECPVDKRQREREAERRERRQHEVRNIEQQAASQANAAAWEEWFRHRLITEISRKDEDGGWFIDMMGEVLADTRKVMRKEFETKLAVLETRIKEEHQASLEARFFELERRLDAHAQDRNEAKRESEMIPQSELTKIEKLQRRVDELESVAELDGCFRELIERVGELEKTSSLEARFNKLAHQAERRSEIPQGELLEKIEGLQRHVDELKGVTDLDARFSELVERVSELEKTNSLEARFNRLADEVKRGSETSELLARLDRLERQLDDPKKVASQPGPPWPPGPPGKLSLVREYVSEHVHHERAVVTHAGALWQARGDTVHAPPHADWICLARTGRNGSDGRSPNARGAYDGRQKYERLDIVALDDASFIARRDNPGTCPGDGWQLLSRQGRIGHRGETGERGPRGEKGDCRKGRPCAP